MQRAAKNRHYIRVMESMGYPATAVLEGSDINASNLDEPGFAIEVRQCKTVVANMIRLSDNQAIGFEMGNQLRMTDMGIFDYAIMSSRTFLHAIDLWARYDTTLAGMLIRHDLAQDSEGNWGFTMSEIEPLGFLYSFCCEE